jgi:WD40 repeat protein
MLLRRIILFTLLALLGYTFGQWLEPSASTFKNVVHVLETESQHKMGLIFGRSGESSFKVRVIDSATGKKIGKEIRVPYSDLALSDNGERLFSLGEKDMSVYDIATGKRIAHYPILEDDEEVWRLESSQEGGLFYTVSSVGYSSWIMRLFDAETGREILRRGSGDPDSFGMVISLDESKIAVCYSQSSRMELWSVGKKPKLLELYSDTRWVNGAANNRWFCGQGRSATETVFYDFASGSVIAKLPTGHHDDYESTCPDGKLALTWGLGHVKIWNIADAKPQLDIPKVGYGHLGQDGKSLYTVSEEIQVYSVNGGKQLKKMPFPEGSDAIVGFGHRSGKGKIWLHDWDKLTVTSYGYRGVK